VPGDRAPEGLVRSNPCDGAQLPHRPQVEDDDDEDDVRALGRDQLHALLTVAHPRYRLLFTLLAATGLRISEAIALQWRHVQLDGSRPHVMVRRRIVRGKVGPVKSAGSRSNRSRRDVPIPASLVSELRAWRRETEWPDPDDPLFPTLKGTPLSSDNVRKRYLAPAAEEADVAWCGFHTLRHTFASLHIARGTNVVQLSRLLGHHAPSFTLDVYSHLLEDGVGAPLDLEAELARGANIVQTPAALGGPKAAAPPVADSR
jgi:integrase